MKGSPPLLDVRGLTVTYPNGRRTPPVVACRDVDVEVAAGETVGLVGESGSGKTTLGAAVLGLVPVGEGTIRFRGEDITYVPGPRRRALTEHLQIVFQDSFGSLNPARTVGQTLREPLEVHRRLAVRQRQEQVLVMLERVGLPASAADRYPGELSGGQRQRVAIGRALMLEPELVICDEAVSALDLSVQAQILNLLGELQRDLGVGYLFVSHDMAVIRHMADRVVVLYRGHVVETGEAGAVYERPEHPYTQALLASTPLPDPSRQQARRARPRIAAITDITPAEDGCPFLGRCPHARPGCREPQPPVASATGVVACHRHDELVGRPQHHRTGALHGA